jgi:Poly(R)-hydroxyalkanoic acid synthase subunit (PHA_synth_III_E)
VNSTGTPQAWFEQWRSLLGSAAGGGAASGIPGLKEAGAAFERFAADFAATSRTHAPGEPPSAADVAATWRNFAERFAYRPLPIPPLPGVSPSLSAALGAWSKVQSAIAAEISARFAARLGSGADAPRSLRAAFDAWIECAEAAFQVAAHDEAFTLAQARLLNELVTVRAEQQQLLDRASRLAGMPTRAEVDALHDSVHGLRAALAEAATPAAAARPRARAKAATRAPRARPKKRKPRA